MNKKYILPAGRIPVSKCTVAELAQKLMDMDQYIEINFSVNEDGSDYFGAERHTMFECDMLYIGYYGHANIYSFDLAETNIENIINELKYEFHNDTVYLFEIQKPNPYGKFEHDDTEGTCIDKGSEFECSVRGSWQIIHSEREGLAPIKVTEQEGDIIEVYLCPNKHPVAYHRKRDELMKSNGMSEDEADKFILTTPFVLEIFYAIDQGLFAVESEPLLNIAIYNPYSGEEIPNEII